MNMAKYVSRGSSIQILYEDINEKVVTEALEEILNNPKYMKNAKHMANRFKDRPMTPQQSVVYWTEFAARNRDSQYIKSIASDLNFIQLHLIDVYFVSFSIIVALLLLIYVTFKALLIKTQKFVKSSDEANESKKKQ